MHGSSFVTGFGERSARTVHDRRVAAAVPRCSRDQFTYRVQFRRGWHQLRPRGARSTIRKPDALRRRMTDAPKHTSYPDPANELARDHSSINPRDFRNALGTYATGVTIITAVAADGRPYGLTCNSFASVSLNPPLVLWSLGMFSQGLSVFQNASHFAVNVLGESQQALATKFAKSSEDKFAGVEWKPGLGNAPLLADSVANFQCRAANRYYGGDHVIFFGAVGAYDYNRHEPLLFSPRSV